MKKMNKKGFTLVEMLVVIAIIAILVSILIPTVLGATKKAKAATDAANLRSELAAFQIDYLTEGAVDDYTQQSSNNAIYIAKKATTAKSISGSVYIAIYVPETGDADAAYVNASTLSAWETAKGKACEKNIAYFAAIADGSGSESTTSK